MHAIHQPFRCFRVTFFLAMIGLLCAFALCATSARAAETTAWELLPYRIEVHVALADAPQLTPRRASDLVASISNSAVGTVGGRWDLTVRTAEAEHGQRWLRGLDALQVGDLPAEWETATADKIILLTVFPHASTLLIHAREFDARTRMLGVTVEFPVLQAEQLNRQAFQAVLAAFAPVAQFVTAESKAATLKMRGAALPLRDPQLQFGAVGDIWRAAVRINDRFGNARRIETIEWTLLQTDSIADGQMHCVIQSGMKNPISGRQRGRMEQLAVRIGQPTGNATRLRLIARDRRARPLAGYEIHAFSPGGKELTLLGLTDTRGEISIPQTDEAIRILVVKNGGELLARLPLVPGLQTHLDAAIPDDDSRLEVEGFVAGLQENIVDWFAAREVLMAQIRVRMEKREFAEARKIMDQLRDLQKKQSFGQRLANQKRQSVADDVRVQRRMNKLFEDTQQIMTKYANPADVAELERQLVSAERGVAAPPPVGTAPAVPAATSPAPAAGTTVAMP